MATLSDLQFSYRGLVFGEGSEFGVNRVEGLEGFETRVSDADLPRSDGAIRGVDFVAPRLVTFELAIIELTGGATTYEQYWAQIRAAFRPSRTEDLPLTFARPGMPERFIRARPVSLIRTETYRRYNVVGFPPIALRAADPRIYSAELHSANAAVYSSVGGGADFGLDYGVDFTGGVQTELVVDNAGDADAFPVVRFYGPTAGTCTGVSLTNTTTGQVLDINAAVASGQILTADMEAAVTGANRLVVALGGSSRYGSWAQPRTPFALAPGSNVLRFEVDGTTTDMVANLQWRDTWLD